MRIDPATITSLGEARARGTNAPKPDDTAKDDASSVVALGPAARSSGSSAVDRAIAAKIDRVKSLLAEGNYPVDLDKLASRITDDEFARGGAR